jgi:two-component system cell cycle sensor histidine kinase/response regulator CckA
LLVEDEESVRKLVMRLLQGWGYKVLAASNPAQAEVLFAANASEIALLLSDVIMPGGTGPELYQRLHKQYPTLKALFISGYNDSASIAHDKLAPHAAFLQKPFRNHELANAIYALMQ